MTDPVRSSAAEIAAAVRGGRLSSREATLALLERIERVDPALGAVVEVDRDGALAAADRADAVPPADRTGALHGVPVTVKEAIPVAGLRSTWGEPAFAGAVSPADAEVVRRLRLAGAVVLGTTNVAQLLADFGATANPVYGRTSNPWDLRRSPGGSSGGAAAAVAAGLSALDVGSDLVGSVRIPAALCGVYGLRPSAGTVPLLGFAPPGVPFAQLPLDDLATLGPLTRTAGDLRLALRVVGGPAHAPDEGWTPAPPRHRRLPDFRVRFVLDDPAAPVEPEVGAVLSDLVDRLAAAGVAVRAGWPDGADPRRDGATLQTLLGAYFAVRTGGEVDAAELAAAERRRAELRAAWDRAFTDADVVLCPATVATAPLHDDRPPAGRTLAGAAGPRPATDLAAWVVIATLTGVPAVVAPAGATGGLPVGVQILGPRSEDDTAVTFAELLAGVAGGYRSPPDPG
ncbi:amidase family protein [Nakamurella endophytica]|uniref:Amidase n=1 Tax=Nakamurella endophytica TaxID=1748367 RepID=A0A917SNT9_9ACTN|nr:amidase family protein [Nakamurella endophytica]GGL91252.1 amidase [Nakamurella endophytica]